MASSFFLGFAMASLLLHDEFLSLHDLSVHHQVATHHRRGRVRIGMAQVALGGVFGETGAVVGKLHNESQLVSRVVSIEDVYLDQDTSHCVVEKNVHGKVFI